MSDAGFTESYERDGYHFPVDVLDRDEVGAILDAISSARQAWEGGDSKLKAITQ